MATGGLSAASPILMLAVANAVMLRVVLGSMVVVANLFVPTMFLLRRAYLRVKEKWEGLALVHFSQALRDAVQSLEAVTGNRWKEEAVCL